MTNALNYKNEKLLSELFPFQSMNKDVPSSGVTLNLNDKTVHSYMSIRNRQNLQSLTSASVNTYWPFFYHQNLLSSNNANIAKKINHPITTKEQLLLIFAFFGFSKSKLGEIFGVTRQSIYNWFNGDEVADNHYEKIKRLAGIVSDIEPEPAQQIFHVYANEVMEGYDKSLFNYLLDDDFDRETVLRLSKTVYRMSKERWKRIDAMPKAKYYQND